MGVPNGNYNNDDHVHSVVTKLLTRHKIHIIYPYIHIPPLLATVKEKIKYMKRVITISRSDAKSKRQREKWKKQEYVTRFSYKTDSPTKRKLEETIHEERKRRKVVEEKFAKAKTGLIEVTREKEDLEKKMKKNLLTQDTRRSARKKVDEFSPTHFRRKQRERLSRIKDSVSGL
ncbi:hypothetical protein HOLleu_04742 [Holothuria leucospilota]|uniref:Uncharacterized protein n=1 Tax=Holothuria leucospilota TaxID=206669 RepID=A0A9Q1CIN8_HOLLE|nr:hypothetical protein HOLleu_04742 [Holothuria leucospilota]